MTIRPFYVIAHHCNDENAVKSAISEGANAIEFDVMLDATGTNWMVAHDLIELMGNNKKLVTFLDGIRETLKTHKTALLIFDCKTPVASKICNLIQLVRTHLTDHVPVNVMFSTASFGDREFFKPLKNFPLKSNEGVAIDEDNDSERVTGFFHALGLDHHAYGNGIIVCGIAPKVPGSIMNAIARRAISGHLKMVYVWTLADSIAIRNYMRMGVDGVMVNDSTVTTVRKILKEEEFTTRLRLATQSDRPFTSSPAPAYILDVKTADVGSGGTDALLRFSVVGAGGKVNYHLDTGAPGLFEAADMNRVTIFGDVGVPKKLSISRDNRGNAPGWYLSSIEVRKTKGTTPSFPATNVVFNQWIESDTVVEKSIT